MGERGSDFAPPAKKRRTATGSKRPSPRPEEEKLMKQYLAASLVPGTYISFPNRHASSEHDKQAVVCHVLGLESEVKEMGLASDSLSTSV